MIKKVLANILLNIAIIILAFSLIWFFKNQYLIYAVLCLPGLAICIYLKIRLIKNVRNISRKDK